MDVYKHTPGPWRVEYENDGGYDCMTDALKIKGGSYYGETVAVLDLHYYGQEHCQPGAIAPQLNEAKANALLIANAPHLLEKLKLAVEILHTKGEHGIAAHCEATIKHATEP